MTSCINAAGGDIPRMIVVKGNTEKSLTALTFEKVGLELNDHTFE